MDSWTNIDPRQIDRWALDNNTDSKTFRQTIDGQKNRQGDRLCTDRQKNRFTNSAVVRDTKIDTHVISHPKVIEKENMK